MSTQENNNKKRRNIVLSVIAILLTISIVIGISYAYWASRVNQTSINTVSSDCLKLEFTDENPIELEKAYPISDSDAAKLTPYSFTIKNICNMSIAYDVTLEIMNVDDRLASEFIALQIDDDDKRLLNRYPTTTPTYSDSNYTAVEARRIKNGTLESKESVTYSIRLWMDESVTSEDSMNKYFTSKISVAATQEKDSTTLLDYISTLAITDTENLTADDETDDHNIRYIGADPNNYLCFDENCSTGKWRVIGLMNNMTTANGTQNLVKIIRADSIGSNKWDDNNVNDWTTATLQTNLNSGNFYTTYIKKYDNLFETVTWKLGGAGYKDEWTTNNLYTLERGDSVYSGHETTWSGKIGLMYPSDYGFATSGGATTDRTTCLATNLNSWASTDPDVSDCKNNDYLYLGSYEWTITPHSGIDCFVSYVNTIGYIGVYYANYRNAIRPAGYLVSKTKILSGNGTKKTPWIIGA